jgi:hypothetical protein
MDSGRLFRIKNNLETTSSDPLLTVICVNAIYHLRVWLYGVEGATRKLSKGAIFGLKNCTWAGICNGFTTPAGLARARLSALGYIIKATILGVGKRQVA